MSKWKKQALSELPEIFKNGRKPVDLANEPLVAQLYQQIGQLKVELDWLQKKQAFSVEEKRSLVAPSRKILVGHQCELLRLACCSLYYKPAGESEQNLYYMRLLDEQYTKTPFYGVLRMTAFLRSQSSRVNPKRVARLMQKMGLVATYPKPKMSRLGEQAIKYPYLLRGQLIDKPNQAWSTDVTYIRLTGGFVYTGGDNGLVFSLCAVLGTVQFTGCLLLSVCSGKSALSSEAGDF